MALGHCLRSRSRSAKRNPDRTEQTLLGGIDGSLFLSLKRLQTTVRARCNVCYAGRPRRVPTHELGRIRPLAYVDQGDRRCGLPVADIGAPELTDFALSALDPASRRVVEIYAAPFHMSGVT